MRLSSLTKDSRGALRKLIEKLPPPSFQIQETRLFKKIRVPIVILKCFTQSGLAVEVDVSMGFLLNGFEKGGTDWLVREMLKRAPQVLPMVRLVKQWTKLEGMYKAFDGFLNSLGWTLLVLFFYIMRSEIAPPLDLCTSAAAVSSASASSALAVDEPIDFPKLWSMNSEWIPDTIPEHGEVPLEEDIISFLDFVAGLKQLLPLQGDEGAWGISIIDGKLIRGPRGENAPFFVEDPGVRARFGRSENVARCLRLDSWEVVLERCRSLSLMFREKGPGSTTAWVASIVERAVGGCGPSYCSARKSEHGKYVTNSGSFDGGYLTISRKFSSTKNSTVMGRWYNGRFAKITKSRRPLIRFWQRQFQHTIHRRRRPALRSGGKVPAATFTAWWGKADTEQKHDYSKEEATMPPPTKRFRRSSSLSSTISTTTSTTCTDDTAFEQGQRQRFSSFSSCSSSSSTPPAPSL